MTNICKFAFMKIAFIIHNRSRTGPWYKVLEQCAAIAELGHQVTLFCTSPSRRLKAEEYDLRGVRVFESPDLLWSSLRQGIDPWNIWHRIRRAKMDDFDIVHAVDSRPAVIYPALSLKKSQHIPLILSWWDLFGQGGLALERSGALYNATLGKFESWIEKAYRLDADGATAITSWLGRHLNNMGFAASNILVQHVGCETRIPLVGKEEARRSLGWQNEKRPVFCFIGTIYPVDLSMLLKALAILQRRIDYRLLWLGKSTIPAEVAAAHNIEQVGVVPSMDDVFRYFRASDICILPMQQNRTNMARWPSKIADYMNAGRPIVATPVSDLPEIYERYDFGWLARSSEPEDFAEALLSAALSPGLWSDKGKIARTYAVKHLDVRVLAAELVEFYRHFTAKTPPQPNHVEYDSLRKSGSMSS